MRKIVILAAIFYASFTFVNADDNNYSIGKKISFESTILDEERSILVYTPASYGINNQSYPVLYLLDGSTHFHHASGIVQFLSAQGLIPEMIVIAVLNVDRTRDFSPTHVSNRPTTGGAGKFLSFVEEELIPFVNRNYSTLSYKILAGHSFGGEFATYALLNRPKLFNAYIAISPYMMYDDSFIIDETRTKLKSNYKNVQFYMTIGDEPNYFETLDNFEDIIKEKSPKGLQFTYVKMLNENHGSVPHLSIYKGLESIYSDWKLPAETFEKGLASIDNHYKMLSDKYDYPISTPEFTINALGYHYLNKKEINKAIEVFEENIKRYPNSANVYDSLGEAYETNKQLDLAKINYQKAVDIALTKKHPNLKLFEENLKRVQKK